MRPETDCDGIIRAALEERLFHDHPGRHHAYDLAAHQPSCLRWILNLVAHGDAEAGAEQLADVALEGVIGHARQGETLAFSEFPGGQRDAEDGRDPFGILAEGFIEVAQPEEHDRVRMLTFDLQVLVENRARLQRRGLVERAAFQLPGRGLLDCHPSHTSDLSAQRGDADHHPVLPAPATEFAGLRALDQHLDRPAQPAAVRLLGNPTLRLQQDVDAPLLLLGIDIVRLARCRGTGPGRKALDVNDVELDLFEQLEGPHELLLGLTRVAHDHIGRDR